MAHDGFAKVLSVRLVLGFTHSVQSEVDDPDRVIGIYNMIGGSSRRTPPFAATLSGWRLSSRKGK